jgi:hypothetical protein
MRENKLSFDKLWTKKYPFKSEEVQCFFQPLNTLNTLNFSFLT